MTTPPLLPGSLAPGTSDAESETIALPATPSAPVPAPAQHPDDGREALRARLAAPLHIPALDGLRAIAILLVIARHASALRSPGDPASVAVYDLMRTGWVGVDLFFALSGFLITGILVDTKGTAGFLRNFYARRTLRIFPLYFFFLALVFWVAPYTAIASHPTYPVLQQHQGWLWSYLTNVLLVLRGPTSVPLNLSHLWSLALEEQFYLVWPFVVLLVPARHLLRACLALSALAVGLRIAVVLQSGWGNDANYMLMPLRLDALLLGGALAILVRSADGRAWVQRHGRSLGIAALGVLLALTWWQGGFDRNNPYMQVAGYLALSLGSVALIAAALPSSGAKRWRRFLSLAPLQALGKYSYAIYVFQYPIIRYLEMGFRGTVKRATGGSTLAAAVAILVVATVLSYIAARVSWRLLEEPMLRLKRYFPRGDSVA